MRVLYKNILLLFILIIVSKGLYSQTDTSYWFVAPEVSVGHADRPIYIRITAFNDPVNIRITLPAIPSFTPITRSISANTTITIDMTAWIDTLENKPPNTILNKGIKISASDTITCYYEQGSKNNPEIFALKGQRALGRLFYVPTQTVFPNKGGLSPLPYNSFEIVATQNNTQVTITPAKAIVGHAAGVPFTITLNKGQTYCARAVSQAASGHLAGSIVKSNKPIAITVSDDSVNPTGYGCYDLAGDQLIPVNILGKDYVAVKGNLSFADWIFVLGTQANTQVFLNGSGTASATIGAGVTYSFQLSAASVYIRATKPIYVMHMSGFGCEIGTAILPPSVSCVGSSLVSVTRTTNEYFGVNVMCATIDKNNFRFNGATGVINGASFAAVPGTGGLWSMARIDLSTKATVGVANVITNTSGLFHAGVINGGSSSGCRYGYFSDFSNLFLGPDQDKCPNDVLLLDAGIKDHYLWNTGDTTRYLYVVDSGTYYVDTWKVICTASDTIVITNLPEPFADFNITTDTVQCGNNNFFAFQNNSSISTGSLQYYWNFGDGTTSTATNPTHSYTALGVYNVTLMIVSIDGCIDSITKKVYVRPPIALFDINDSTQCFSGNMFNFTNNTIALTGTVTYLWKFGDGDTSTQIDPSHSYTAPGTYQITLIATSSYACTDSIQHNVTVYPMPIAGFVILPDTIQCGNANLFIFANTSSISSGILNYSWDFGDYQFSTDPNPTHTYNTSDSFFVKLTAYSSFGCADSFTDVTYVIPPIISINVNDSIQCLSGNVFNFSNVTTIPFGTVSYLWQFGDGDTSTSSSPMHTYATADTFRVQLKAVSSFGCNDSIFMNVYVYPMPIARFTRTSDTSQCGSSNYFTFKDSSEVPAGNLSYFWKYGDNTSSADTNGAHTYTSSDTFNVTHIVTSSYGCIDSVDHPVYILPPIAKFQINDSTQCFSGNNFSFTNTTSTGTAVITYKWYFGDGDTTSVVNPSHSYATPGTYVVKLVTNSSFGCADSVSKNVYVNPMPVAGFNRTNDTVQCGGVNLFTFQNTSTISSGNLTYLWKLHPGETSTDTNAMHSFPTADTFPVTLVVTSVGGGCIDSITKNVYVEIPIADFYMNDSNQCFTGNNFAYFNTTLTGGASLNYFWKFGDGNTSTAMNPSHVYTAPGIFLVTLVATSTVICKDSITDSVFIYPMPVADFTINDSTQCFLGNIFNFTNASNILSGTLSYHWSFGDTATSVLTDPSHIYNNDDTFLVRMIASSAYFCDDTVSKQLYVYPMPTSLFSIDDSSVCFNINNFTLTNNSFISSGTLSYFWDFGDTTSAITTNANHTYAYADTFLVRLYATSNNLCYDTSEQPVYVEDMPDVNFSINDTSQCFIGNNFSFISIDTIQLGTLKKLWKFGDGDTSIMEDPTHSYAAPGVYNVTLICTSDFFCTDSITIPVNVNPMPVAAFTVNDSTQCLRGNNFIYTNTSTIASGTMTYLWEFGDTDTSTATDPSHSYLTVDTFVTTLITTSGFGCMDTTTGSNITYPMPVAAFTVNDSTQCLIGNNFIFANITTISFGTISYLWNFGDSDTSTSINPSHSYSTPDTFPTKLIATSNFMCSDSVTMPMYVYPMPIADFSINDTSQCLSGNDFVFTNSSIITSGTLSYLWDFGDTTTSTATDTSHTYNFVNTYTVKLVATSGFGCKDSTTKNNITYPMPVAAYTVNDTSQCLRGNNFVFTNISTIPSGTMSYLWRFGDSDTSTSTNPAHSYATSDTFTTQLIATSGFMCSDSVSKPMYVYPMPVAAYTVNDTTQCLVGNNFIFTNGSSISSGTMTYYWDYNDGNSSTATNPVYSYSTVDTFRAFLVATSNFGCADTANNMNVIYHMPVADFAINDSNQCLSGNSFLFTNTSTIPIGSMTYLWRYGDLSTSTSTNPVHTYITSDTFTVQLVVTSGFMCTDSVSIPVNVYPMPLAAFTINDTTQCLRGNNFVFTNGSTIPSGTISYLWDFGDTTTSILANPAHAYVFADTHTVKLLAISGFGCMDSTSKNNITYPTPVAAFIVDDSTQCLTVNNIAFTNTSIISSGTITYFWDFGDTTSSTLTNPNHTYSSADTFIAKLIATSDYFCTDSTTNSIAIYPKATPSFTINTDPQCLSTNNFVFTNTTTIPLGTVTYLWEFGDGDTSTLASPNHSYAAAGPYTLKLKTTSNYGCIDSVTRIVNVYPSPNPAFTINDSTQCLSGNNFAFSNGTTTPSGILTYLWRFGDADTSTLVNPNHSYTTADTFIVELVATVNNLCSDSVSRQVIVYPMPVAAFAINDSTQCLSGNSFVYSNLSTIASGTMSYLWDFGDTTTTTDTNTTHTYNFASTYTVKLVSTSGFGCKDSASKDNTTYPMPDATFAINDSSQCLRENNFIFTNGSTVPSGTITYLWDFGDTDTSTLINPAHIYGSADTFIVKQIATSNFGCKDSVNKNVYVHPMPVAAYTVNDTTQCLSGNNFVFTNGSTITSGTMSYLWDFDDATTSTAINPNHIYATTDTFNASLIVTSNFSCIDTAVNQNIVYHMPVAAFLINDSTQCLRGNNFVFTNTSTIPTGTITYQWDFGDTTTSTSTNPNRVYNFANTYAVKLIVTSGFGCKDSTTKNNITYPMPVAAFTVNDSSQCLSGNNFVFTNSSIIPSGTMSYLWRFGDLSTNTSTSPSHSYSTADTFTTQLITISGFLCSDSISKPMYVYPMPLAAFTINDSTQCLRGNNFVFTNGSGITSGTISYLWDFGDTTTSTANSPSHVYNFANSYAVKLLVTSGFGCMDSIIKNNITYPMPVAEFIVNDSSQCLSGNNFVFTNNSGIPSGTMSYLWRFGDSGTSISANPSHNYATADTFTTQLVVTSGFSCSDSISKPMYVYPMPVSAFIINDSTQCLRGNNFVFTNGSTIPSGTISYLWDFGDTTTSVVTNPGHTYNFVNTYAVKLVTTSGFGCKDSASKNNITYPMPVAAFIVDDSTQCLTVNNIVFTNTSSIPSGTISYVWDFGDTTSSTLTNPSHAYSSADTFIAKLIATSDYFCTDSITKNIVIYPKATPSFTINTDPQCLSTNNFVFTNTTTIPLGSVTYLWEFGDGDTSTLANPNHVYAAAGPYTLKLKTLSNYGCVDSLVRIVNVYPSPNPAFSINDSTQCLSGNNFIFTNNTTTPFGSLTYLWDFGDATASTLSNPNHNYTTADTFMVKMVATVNNLCRDSVTKPVIVYPMPVTSFAINDSTQCLSGNNFVFTNFSSISSGTISYLWDFGDTTSSVALNPGHTYGSVNTFNVKLLVTSNFACKDSVSRVNIVYPMPVAAFTVNDSTQCFRDNNFVFTNASTISSGSMSYLWDFGDATTSVISNPNHSYASVNTFNVKLIATSNFGCMDSLTSNNIVYPMPVAAFAVNDSTQCLSGNNFIFTNGSTISSGTISYLWDFNDATTSTASNPNHNFSTTDTFNVSLIVTSNYSCIDTVFKKNVVYHMPVAAYLINDSTQCLRGNNFVFTNSSTIPTGTISYLWDFGDTTTSTTSNPNHVYNFVNTYQVKLVVTSGFGCKDSVTSNNYVYPMPVAAYIVNDSTQCLSGNNFVYTNGSSISSGTLTYMWRYGDGATSSGTSPNHSFITPNTFNTNLIATSGFICSDSVIRQMYVYHMPSTTFGINDSTQCIRGNNFIFTNNSNIPSGTLSYVWDFGDASTSTTTNPNHSYLTSNNFLVKLVSTSNNGCKDSTTRTNSVYPMPVSAFTVNDSTQCLTTNNISFTNSSTIPSGTMTYLWQFGDNSTSTFTDPTHAYTSSNTFTAKLIATSGFACADSTTRNIEIYPKATPTFTINTNPQCLSTNGFVFTNTSTIPSGSLTYLWKFGDNTTSTLMSPSHAYTAAGSYTVKLITTSNYLCVDSVSMIVNVYPSPNPSFTVNDSTQCLKNNNFAFTNTSTTPSGTLTYLWRFGDATTSTAISPNHSYTSANNFNVELVATVNNLCKDSVSKTMVVYPMPTISFNINDNAQCLPGNNFTFTNTSSISSGTLSYLWRFGDNTTSTVTDPTHSYSAANTYNVRLISVSDFFCTDSITTPVYVYPMPIPAFSINDSTQCVRGNIFTFTNASTISSGTMSYIWSFGDNTTSAFTSPSHTYTTPNPYTVKLRATSNNGCVDSISRIVEIYPMPSTSFAINDNTQCFKNNSFIFTNNSTIPTGTITYKWHFGDTTSSTLNNPTHSYAYPNTYTVKLVSTSDYSCGDSTTTLAYVYPMPAARFTINDSTQCLRGNNFVFANGTSISSGSMSYLWNFGDNITSTSLNTSHTYTTFNNFNVKIVATSNFGCKDSINRGVEVYPMPTTNFTINDNTQCLAGNSFIFTNNSSIPTGNLKYLWRFGDNTTDTVSNPTHSYVAENTYTVKLISTSEKACLDSTTTNVTVFPKPMIGFNINDSSQCLRGNNFTFANTSTISSGSMTYLWRFGDNSTSLLPNPTHSYTSYNTYPVTLVATTNLACKDSITRNVIVYPMPVAGFNINDSTQCLNGNNFVFTNTSTIPTGNLSYIWQFGDATMSVLTNPNHTYLTENTYPVKLIAVSDYNCFDSAINPLIVYPMPKPLFSVNDGGQCLSNNNFVFTNGSTISSGTMNYNWNFGDNTTSLLKDPLHSYSNYDTFLVKMRVTSDYSCTDSVNQSIFVYPVPVSGYTINDSNQCLKGNIFTFSDQSSIPLGSINYLWQFGDGITSTLQSPTHTYLGAYTYQVKLLVTSDNNCNDSTIVAVTVYPMPKPAFFINDNTQCLTNNSCSFLNASFISSGTISYLWDFDDGQTSALLNPVHSYATFDSFNVRLIATSNYTCVDTAISKVIIYPMPVASFTINDSTQCLRGNNFIFTNTSSIPYGPLISTWQFGDNTTSSLFNPSHSYKNFNTYNVKMRTVSNNQCADSVNVNVFVYPMPKANFVINDSTQCLKGNNFIFTNNSTIPSGNMSSFWQFGDNNTSTQNNPSHIYSAYNTYRVMLHETSDFQCVDSMIKNMIVYPMPDPRFSTNDSTQCLKSNSFIFINASTIPNGSLSYYWEFGDGYTSTNPIPAHKYDTDTSYEVKLQVTSNNQCTDSVKHRVYIYPDPEVSLGKDTVVCPGDKIELDPGFYFSYLWQDGSTDQIFVTTEPGDFKVTITDENGCKATDIMTIKPKCDLSLWVPTAFTPDGDGVNDDLDVVAINWKTYEIRIFDRWGTLVYHSFDYTKHWDGTFKGELVQMDAFYVQVYVKYKSGEKRQVHQFVYVLR